MLYNKDFIEHARNTIKIGHIKGRLLHTNKLTK